MKQTLANMLRVVLIFAGAAAACFLISAGINGDEAGNVELRLIGMHDNRLVVLLEDSGKLSAYYKDASNADSALTKAGNVAETGCAFFQNGGSMGIAERFNDELHVKLYSFDRELALDGFCPFSFSFSPKEDDNLVFAEVGPDTYTMYILSSDGSLRSCEVLCKPEETALLSGVTFLGSTPGGWIYAYSGGALRRWTGNRIENSEVYWDLPRPERLIGENVYIGDTGTLVKIQDGACQEYSLDIDGINSRACFGTDDCFIAADSTGLIHKYEWAGEDIREVATAVSDGEILGILENYVLTKKDNQLCLTQLMFHEPGGEPGDETDPTPTPIPGEDEEPTPSPQPDADGTPEPDGENGGQEGATPTPDPGEDEEPTPSPQPDADGTPEPDGENGGQEGATPTPDPSNGEDDETGKLMEELNFKELTGENGKYAAMSAGARVADLRKIYKPQSIAVFTKDGKPVFESLLKTGMKISIGGEQESVSVIIRGDCDGDGKVAKSDITFASLYIINMVYAETDFQFMAMDMNGDGRVDIWDLPLIADETRRRG